MSESSSGIEAVIFDYGGVISTAPFRGIAEFEERQGYPTGSMLRMFLGEYNGERVDDSAAANWHLLETGKLQLADFLEQLVDRSPDHLDGRNFDLDAYAEFSMQAPFGVHWMMIHRVRELRANGYRLAVLTNNVVEWGPVWKATFPVAELFDHVVDSCEVGLRKPDPKIFHLTCDRLGVKPEASVFLDDSATNVNGAQAVGMRTVLVGDNPWAALEELDQHLAAG